MKDKCGEYILVVCPNPSIDTFAWIEEFKEKEANRITREESYPGGKGVHVAMAVAEMEFQVKLLGFWGGITGQWIKTECEKRYPNIECVGPNVGELSRTCYTFKSETSFDDTEILGEGPSISKEKYSLFIEYAETYIPKVKNVVMSGSWPDDLNAGYQELIKISNSHKKNVFLDCTGVNLENALKERPYLIHLNKSEAINFTGTNEILGAAHKLLNFCEVIAITDGVNGLHLITSDNHINVSHKLESVYSTIGSGDCLTAGLALAYCKNYSLLDTAKLGASMGAANCIRKELGLLFKTDVEELIFSSKVLEIKMVL